MPDVTNKNGDVKIKNGDVKNEIENTTEISIDENTTDEYV